MNIFAPGFLKTAESVKTDEVTSSLSDTEDPNRELAKKFLAVGSPALSVGAVYALNKLNESVPQNNELGKLFQNFASNEIVGPDKAIIYRTAIPRTTAEVAKNLDLSPTLMNMIKPPNASATALDATRAKNSGEIQAAIGDIIRQFAAEESGNIPNSVLKGFSPPEMEMLRNSTTEELVPWATKRYGLDKGIYRITAPRNNIHSLAHEAGHIDDFLKWEQYGNKTLGGIVDNPTKFVDQAMELLAGTADGFLHGASPMYSKFMHGLEKDSPLIGEVAQRAMAMPIAGGIGALLGSSQTARDVVRKVLPFEATDSAMDFVEEHPVATAVSGFMPQLISEAYTSVPGYDLVKKFYEGINNIGPGNMTAEVKSALGGLAGKIGKISPELEAWKFLGHNSLANLTYALAPLTAAAIAYINKPDTTKE